MEFIKFLIFWLVLVVLILYLKKHHSKGLKGLSRDLLIPLGIGLVITLLVGIFLWYSLGTGEQGWQF